MSECNKRISARRPPTQERRLLLTERIRRREMQCNATHANAPDSSLRRRPSCLCPRSCLRLCLCVPVPVPVLVRPNQFSRALHFIIVRIVSPRRKWTQCCSAREQSGSASQRKRERAVARGRRVNNNDTDRHRPPLQPLASRPAPVAPARIRPARRA